LFDGVGRHRDLLPYGDRCGCCYVEPIAAPVVELSGGSDRYADRVAQGGAQNSF